MNKYQRWKEGMKNLTPAQQMHAQMIGTIGNIFGMIFAAVFLFMKGAWYFIFIFIFTIFLQVVSYIGIKQKYESVKLIEKQMELAEIDHSLHGGKLNV